MSHAFREVTPFIEAAHHSALLRDEVLRRMEVYVLELLHHLLATRPSPDTAVTEPSRATLPLSQTETTKREQFAPHVNMQTLQRTRQHLLVLALLFANVQRGLVQTHRDVYYHLVRAVPTQLVVNRTVQQLARVLRVPRQLMGVTAGGRGYVAGVLYFNGVLLETLVAQEGGMPLPLLEADLRVSRLEKDSEGSHPSPPTKEISTGERSVRPLHGHRSTHPMGVDGQPAGRRRSVSPNPPCAPSSFPRGFQVPSHVPYILVIEKHAVLVHLLRAGLPRFLPCILLTAQGFPTHAAHRLLANLHAALPHARVVGMVDYNPHGLAILAAYRWAGSGSTHSCSFDATCPNAVGGGHARCTPPARQGGSMPENRFCAVPCLRWLALRARHLRCSIEEEDDATVPSMKDKRSLEPDGAAKVVNFEPLCSTHMKRARELPCLHASNDTSCTRAFFPPPLQPFTARDGIVLDNVIRQLEARLKPERASVQQQQPEMDDSTNAVSEEAQIARAPSLLHAPPRNAELTSIEAWLEEARAMRQGTGKCELEVLYTEPYARTLLSCTSRSMPPRKIYTHPTPADECRGHPSASLSERPLQPAAFATWVCEQLLRGQFI